MADNGKTSHRQYVHRLKKWGLRRYNAHRETTGSSRPLGGEDNKAASEPPATLGTPSGLKSKSQSKSISPRSLLDDWIPSKCDSDLSQLSLPCLPASSALGVQEHPPRWTRGEHGRTCNTGENRVYEWHPDVPWAATSLDRKKQAADFLLTLSYHDAAFRHYFDILSSVQRQLPDQDSAFKSAIITCARLAREEEHITVLRDILQQQVNAAQNSSEALFYRLLRTYGFRQGPQHGDRSELDAYIAMTSLFYRSSDNRVILVNPSRFCRSIDMIGYLLLNRIINRWAEVCGASVDDPLLAPDTNHLFFKPDILHQYVLQQPLYMSSLNQHTTVRSCVTWYCEVLRYAPDRCSFSLLDLRPFGEPAEQKEQAKFAYLLWHALHTLYTSHPERPSWASNSEQDLGISAVELLSVICRLILRQRARHEMHQQKGKAMASHVGLEAGITSGDTETFEMAREAAQALAMRDDEELWNLILAEFLRIDENCTATPPSPVLIPSSFDMDVPKDRPLIIVEAVDIEVPCRNLASRGSVALASTECVSATTDEQEPEPYSDGPDFRFLLRGGYDAEPDCSLDANHGTLAVFGTGDSWRDGDGSFDSAYPLDIMSSLDGSPMVGLSTSQPVASDDIFLGPSPHMQPFVSSGASGRQGSVSE